MRSDRPGPVLPTAASAVSLAKFALHAMLFIAAADLTAVDVGGANVRMAWIFLPLVAFLLPRFSVGIKWTLYAIAFFAVHVYASLVSDAVLKGLGYSVWILFTFYYFFRLGYGIARILGPRMWDVIVVNGRIQIILAIILHFMFPQVRAKFLYYEPSYMAIALIPYVAAIVFFCKRKAFDFFLLLGLVVFGQSGNLLLVFFICYVWWVWVSGFKFKTIAATLVVLLFGSVLYIRALVNPEDANHNLAVALYLASPEDDVVLDFLGRGGNRLPRFLAGWEVAADHLWTGVGPGNYIKYSSTLDFFDISGDSEYLDPTGLPAVNVLVESTANAGLLSAICMVAFYLHLMYEIFRSPKTVYRRLMLCSMVAMGLAMQMESNYLRAYLWLFMGTFAGFCAIAQHQERSVGLRPATST